MMKYWNCDAATCQQKCRECKGSDTCDFECDHFTWEPQGGMCKVFKGGNYPKGANLVTSHWPFVSGAPTCDVPTEKEFEHISMASVYGPIIEPSTNECRQLDLQDGEKVYPPGKQY